MLTRCPTETASPVMYPQTATMGTSNHGAVAAVIAPTKVDTAMPALATATAVTRLRVSPWKETTPTGSAPRAT
jgi:hypothetical protein